MLKIYNTLSRKSETFKPNEKVKAFVCGPTVYDYAHLGHAKTYIQFDFIIKYLRYKKFNVFYLQNITDIDDKIIKKANEEKIDWKELSRKFEKLYIEDMNSLGIDSVDKYARATDYIKEIVSQVKRLIEKGYAYKISDGYYFDTSKFKDYGKLAKRTNLEENDSVSRIDENKEKKNKIDFCLLKFSKPGEPYWEDVIEVKDKKVKFRPGWHIEDTAITEKELGEQYDLHGGGLDLITPHHEAEIAQMEAISGKEPFVKYWIHAGFLKINKEKMSKSLGNFKTVRDVLKIYNKNTIRFLFISSHYRKPLDFSEEALEQAKNSVEKLNEFILKLNNYNSKSKDYKKLEQLITKTRKEFEKSIDNDFETAQAIASLFEFTREINKLISEEKLSNSNIKTILEFMKELNSVLGFIELEKEKIPKEILELVNKREEVRKNKNFKESDVLRDKIKSLGYLVQDTEKGPILKKL